MRFAVTRNGKLQNAQGSAEVQYQVRDGTTIGIYEMERDLDAYVRTIWAVNVSFRFLKMFQMST